MELAGYTPLEVLHKTLQENSWKYVIKQDSEGHILSLIFAHPESVKYANQYNRVFFLDCSHKTTRYSLPFLYIYGVSPSYPAFSVAFCFMQNDQQESYTWALESFFSFLGPSSFSPVIFTDREPALLDAMEAFCPKYPHLLSVWNMNKSIRYNTKQYFDQKDTHQEFLQAWNQLISSATEADYYTRLSELEDVYNGFPQMLGYIKETWLVYKEYFIVAWTQKYLHFGNLAASRVEGSSLLLRRTIDAPGDMSILFEKITHEVQGQSAMLENTLKQDKVARPVMSLDPLYANIVTKTSQYSLKLIKEEARRARMAVIATDPIPLPPCTNVFSRTVGLPCAHRLGALLASNEPIQLTEIHPFWRTGLSDSVSEYHIIN